MSLRTYIVNHYIENLFTIIRFKISISRIAAAMQHAHNIVLCFVYVNVSVLLASMHLPADYTLRQFVGSYVDPLNNIDTLSSDLDLERRVFFDSS